VIYNRAKGPNGGVTFAKDEVTISLGSAGQVSWHQAGLGAPDPASNEYPLFRKPNYNGGSQDLVVKVCGMLSGTEGSTPDLASVLIYLDDGFGGVTCDEAGGGGGGSGGTIKLSACEIRAGSGARLEANGGNGGKARDHGENGVTKPTCS